MLLVCASVSHPGDTRLNAASLIPSEDKNSVIATMVLVQVAHVCRCVGGEVMVRGDREATSLCVCVCSPNYTYACDLRGQ